jgi:hypothetical protein
MQTPTSVLRFKLKINLKVRRRFELTIFEFVSSIVKINVLVLVANRLLVKLKKSTTFCIWSIFEKVYSVFILGVGKIYAFMF